MLRKKTGFKPKAKPTAIRRNAASDQPVEDERLSTTPAPNPTIPVQEEVHKDPSTANIPAPSTSTNALPSIAQREPVTAHNRTADLQIVSTPETTKHVGHTDNEKGTRKQAVTVPRPKKLVAVPVAIPKSLLESVTDSSVTARSEGDTEPRRALTPAPKEANVGVVSANSKRNSSAVPRASPNLAAQDVNLTTEATPNAPQSSIIAPKPVSQDGETPRSRRPSNQDFQSAAENSQLAQAAASSADNSATGNAGRDVHQPIEAANDLGSSGPSSAPNPKSVRKRKATAGTARAATSGSAQGEGSSRPTEPKQARAKKAAPRPADENEQAAGEGSARNEGLSEARNQTRKKRPVQLPGEEGHRPVTAKKTRKRKASAAVEVQDEETERQARFAKRPRETTPEDAENVQVDITKVTMAQLAKDMRIGKKFSLHDELIEREKAKKRKRQLELIGLANADDENSEQPNEPCSRAENSTGAEGDGDNDGSTQVHKPTRPAGQPPPAAEQYQIVDGQIVINARSLQVDRHARAREAAGEMEEQEENEFTNQVNQSTYLRRRTKAHKWSDEDTEQFYYWLARYGTSFDMLAELFPGKTRRHIKLKFNREERANPERIHRTLVDPKTALMDMKEYMTQSGRQYETTEAIKAELQKEQDEFEASERAKEEERLEEQRKKREELLGTGGEDAGHKGKTRKSKKDKQQNSGIVTEILEDG